MSTRLADFVIAKIPRGGSILYLAGEDRAGDLAGALAAAGHPVRTVEVYRAVAATASCRRPVTRRAAGLHRCGLALFAPQCGNLSGARAGRLMSC